MFNATPAGGWLGLGAYEGRGKQRYARGRRMLPSNPGLPNATSHSLRRVVEVSAAYFGMRPALDREPAELKRLSKRRKRYVSMPLVRATEDGTGRSESSQKWRRDVACTHSLTV